MSIEALLEYNERKDLLRLLTAGSVDDGKSTLIGRLLYDSKGVYEDHLTTLAKDSKRIGSAGGEVDYALLTDGLKAEREQGITIDVAYRYFSTPRRKFIIADCPGHEQYTRNMATGASTADLAIILIDAAHGVLDQTRRHSFIASLLGIQHLVVAINKMDLVDYAESVYDQIRADYNDFATRLQVASVHFVPISALCGDNVVETGDKMPWYRGGPLLDHLESVQLASGRNMIDLRFPVQYVMRQDASFRGYCGTVASGILRVGNEVEVLPSGRKSKVKSIVTYDGELDEAFPPMAVTVALEDDIDVSRGDVFIHPRNRPTVADRCEAVLVWMSETPMSREKPYFIKHSSNSCRAEVSRVLYRFDVNTLKRQDADHLELNEIGRVSVTTSRPLMFDPYRRNRSTGSFILIDPTTNGTVGAGMILEHKPDAELDAKSDAASPHLRSSRSSIAADARQQRFGHQPATIWLTGLPGAGKTTTAYALEKRLFDAGYNANVLDGENLRQGISSNLGFAALERSENVRRAAHVARLCNDAGLITVVALVSPFEADRLEARGILGEDRFCEVHISTPLEICEQRDDTGMYARVRAGEVARFTGISSPYEEPSAPDLQLDTTDVSTDEAVDKILAFLRKSGLLPAA